MCHRYAALMKQRSCVTHSLESDAEATEVSTLVFHRLDRSNRGFLGPGEMQHALDVIFRSYDCDPSASTTDGLLATNAVDLAKLVKVMFSHVDYNQDGRLELDEWFEFCCLMFEMLGRRRFLSIVERWLETLQPKAWEWTQSVQHPLPDQSSLDEQASKVSAVKKKKIEKAAQQGDASLGHPTPEEFLALRMERLLRSSRPAAETSRLPSLPFLPADMRPKTHVTRLRPGLVTSRCRTAEISSQTARSAIASSPRRSSTSPEHGCKQCTSTSPERGFKQWQISNSVGAPCSSRSLVGADQSWYPYEAEHRETFEQEGNSRGRDKSRRKDTDHGMISAVKKMRDVEIAQMKGMDMSKMRARDRRRREIAAKKAAAEMAEMEAQRRAELAAAEAMEAEEELQHPRLNMFKVLLDANIIHDKPGPSEEDDDDSELLEVEFKHERRLGCTGAELDLEMVEKLLAIQAENEKKKENARFVSSRPNLAKYVRQQEFPMITIDELWDIMTSYGGHTTTYIPLADFLEEWHRCKEHGFDLALPRLVPQVTPEFQGDSTGAEDISIGELDHIVRTLTEYPDVDEQSMRDSLEEDKFGLKLEDLEALMLQSGVDITLRTFRKIIYFVSVLMKIDEAYIISSLVWHKTHSFFEMTDMLAIVVMRDCAGKRVHPDDYRKGSDGSTENADDTIQLDRDKALLEEKFGAGDFFRLCNNCYIVDHKGNGIPQHKLVTVFNQTCKRLKELKEERAQLRITMKAPSRAPSPSPSSPRGFSRSPSPSSELGTVGRTEFGILMEALWREMPKRRWAGFGCPLHMCITFLQRCAPVRAKK